MHALQLQQHRCFQVPTCILSDWAQEVSIVGVGQAWSWTKVMHSSIWHTRFAMWMWIHNIVPACLEHGIHTVFWHIVPTSSTCTQRLSTSQAPRLAVMWWPHPINNNLLLTKLTSSNRQWLIRVVIVLPMHQHTSIQTCLQKSALQRSIVVLPYCCGDHAHLLALVD